MKTSAPILTMENLWSDFLGEKEKIENTLGIFDSKETAEKIRILLDKNYDVYFARINVRLTWADHPLEAGYYKFYMDNSPMLYVREIYTDNGDKYVFRTLRDKPKARNIYTEVNKEGAAIKLRYNDDSGKYEVKIDRHRKCIVYDENDNKIDVIKDDVLGTTISFNRDAIVFLDQEITSQFHRKRVNMKKLNSDEEKEYLDSIKEEE